MKDLTELYKELQARTDEGARFYREVNVNNEYAIDKNIHYGCVVDLGANVGNFSYHIYNQADNIYAVEANKNNYDILCGYIQKYELDKIKPFHFAIAGSNGIRKLGLAGGCGDYTIVGGTFLEDVEGKTLYTFCHENGINSIDLLKIDIECAEGEVLNAPDSQNLFSTNIKNIVGEDHGQNMRGIIEKLGFKLIPQGNITAIKL